MIRIREFFLVVVVVLSAPFLMLSQPIIVFFPSLYVMKLYSFKVAFGTIALNITVEQH